MRNDVEPVTCGLDATHVKTSVIGRNETNAQTNRCLKQMKPFRRSTRRTIEVSALMDNFVLRGDAAAALAASLADAAPASQRKRHRQTTIHHGDKVVSQERVQYLKEELDDANTTANMLSLLEALEQVFVSLEMLEKTRIGVALTRLSRRAESDEVKDRAQKLLKVWKNRAKKAMRRRARRVETYGRNYAE